MTTKRLHVLGISGDTGGCRLTVPRACIFQGQTPEISEWDYWFWDGEEPATAIEIARKAREIQGLDYKTGPAVVCEAEDYEVNPLNAMLALLHYERRMGDATLHFQSYALTSQITDDTLKRQDLYVDQIDVRAATRHAITLLRRARESREFALALWPYPPNGMP